MKAEVSDICAITYTNSNCHDVLRVHVGQLDKFASDIKSYVLTDKNPSYHLNDHEVILYDNMRSDAIRQIMRALSAHQPSVSNQSEETETPK